MGIMMIVQVMALDDKYLELCCSPVVKKKPAKVNFMDLATTGDMSLLANAAHETQNHIFKVVVERSKYDEEGWNVFKTIDIEVKNI